MAGAPVMIIGASGMLVHRLTLEAVRRDLETIAVVRRPTDLDTVPELAAHPTLRILDVGDLTGSGALERLVDRAAPSVVINAAGVVKQAADAADVDRITAANSELPTSLQSVCRSREIDLIHLSTDCVFSGDRGRYRENDCPDPVDEYGRSKLAGEVVGPGTTTLRTSMIGRQLKDQTGLVEWLIANRGGSVSGFRNAIFSGLTTSELATMLLDLVTQGSRPDGLFHVAAAPIDKAALLSMISSHLGLDVEVVGTDEPRIDRSLDGSRFTAATGYFAPGWPEMIDRLAEDAARYESWRR